MVGRNEESTKGTKEGNGNSYSRCALKGALSTRFNQVRNINPKGVQHQSIQDRKELLFEHNEQKNNVASKRNVHFCPLSFRGAILPLPPTTMLPPKGMCISALFPFEGQYCRCRPRHVNTYSICALKRVLSTRVNQIMNIKPEGAQHQSIQVRKGLLVEHNEEW